MEPSQIYIMQIIVRTCIIEGRRGGGEDYPIEEGEDHISKHLTDPNNNIKLGFYLSEYCHPIFI